MGAGASAPAGVGSSPAPIVAPPVSTPITTPTATPSSTPQGGKGGPTTAGAAPTTPPPVTQSVSPVAPTAPQQPQYNPFMQTYGQNNTPQQQMFNRFPQRFQQPQPVAQGPVYADQSLNAPGNQPQQYGGQPQQPQYGRFGRGFMPQNRGGYERQMDNLRGGYNRPMPPMMPQQDGGYGGGYGQPATGGYFEQSPDINILATRGAKYPTAGQTPIPDYARPFVQQLQGGQQQSPEEYARRRGYQYDPAPSAAPADAEAAWNRTTQQAQFAPGTDMVKAKQDFMQRYNPRPQQPGGMQQAAFMNSLLNGQPLSGQQATRYISPEERNSMEAYYRQDGINQANRLRVSDTPEQQAYANQMIASKGQGIGQQQSPPNAIVGMSRDEMMKRYAEAKANQVNNPSGQQQGTQQAAFMNSLLKGQPLSGQPATGQTPIPAYAQPYATSLANQPNTPAGGKGGNPTATGSGVSPVAPPIGSGFY